MITVPPGIGPDAGNMETTDVNGTISNGTVEASAASDADVDIDKAPELEEMVEAGVTHVAEVAESTVAGELTAEAASLPKTQNKEADDVVGKSVPFSWIVVPPFSCAKLGSAELAAGVGR